MTDRQLELFTDGSLREAVEDSRDAQRIEQYLRLRCSHAVHVRLTDNTSTMISVRRTAGYRVRLHHMFARAGTDILNALAVYIKWPRHRSSNAKLSRYIKENRRLVKDSAGKPLRVSTKGRYYDLAGIYDRVNDKYFAGELAMPITWGRPFSGRRRRSIRFGCVDHSAGIIRINPSLDASFVPKYFVEYIVFHEMLHCVIDTRLSENGRVLAHHGDFKRRERTFVRYDDAVMWQNENFCRFLGKKR